MAEEAQTPEIVDEELAPVAGDGDEEEVPTFGDTVEEEQDTDNATIRHLRQVAREALKRAAEAEARAAKPPATVEVGEKPTLAGCDYDEERYETELDAWKERKGNADNAQTEQQRAAEQQQRQLADRLTKFEQEKASLGRPDADDAVETVKAALGEAKFIGVVGLLDDATDAGKFMYALARNPVQLEALATQADGIKLVKDITRLEGQLKMTKRRIPASIDAPERGSGKVSRETTDQTLAKLEREAERTGIRTDLIAYKRKLRAK